MAERLAIGPNAMLRKPHRCADHRAKAAASKCLVWDLDQTLWDGVLLEEREVTLRGGVRDIIRILDERGILQSIASKNPVEPVIAKLEELGVREYFLYPQINWHSKVASIRTIASRLNIGLDAIAFIDDEPFERDEVSYSLPDVLCLDAAEIGVLLDMPALNPCFVTVDSRRRRLLYLADQNRNSAAETFGGSGEDFLATLDMRLAISRATAADLMRAEELTVRTHQLNTTGITYSYEELAAFQRSNRHLLLIAELEDRYGSYGKIGLALVACAEQVWTLKLFLISCRVMGRGVGTSMLSYIGRLARRAGARLRVEFIANDRNRMMYIAYKFSGFKEINRRDKIIILENDLRWIQEYPSFVRVVVEE